MKVSRWQSLSGTLLVGGILLSGSTVEAQVPGGKNASTRQAREARYRNDVLKAVQPKFDKWSEALTTGNAEDFAELYTDDARLLLGEITVFGRASIEEYFEHVQTSMTGFTMSLSDFYVSDRLAFAMGTYSYQALSEQGHPTRRIESVFVATFVGEGRRWHIRSHLFREPLPDASAEDSRFE